MSQESLEIRRRILEIAQNSGHGHVPTCFSIVELLLSVYGVMRHDSRNPTWPERDIFVLSKGHGALCHYCVLAHLGYFDIERVYSFGRYGSDFGCHADRFKIPGIEVSTGSLGHGIGIAAGIALAFKIQHCSRRVFTVIGDGEANEGSVWEAILVAVNRKLDNLTVLYDNNRSHLRGLQIEDPVAHFRGFGCQVEEVDGHSLPKLRDALNAPTHTVRVVVANTVKGRGCRTLVDDQYAWHRRSPTPQEYQQLLKELDEKTI